MIKMRRENCPRWLVMPRVSPTVPMAEAVSNKHANRGMCSMVLMISPLIKNKTKYISTIAMAVRIMPSPILLPKHSTCSLRLNTATAVNNNTASVEVFKPPAVDPGDPPINIQMIIRDCPPSLIMFKSVVLNPAVRRVTDWKRDGNILCPAGRWLYSRKNSHRKGRKPL